MDCCGSSCGVPRSRRWRTQPSLKVTAIAPQGSPRQSRGISVEAQEDERRDTAAKPSRQCERFMIKSYGRPSVGLRKASLIALQQERIEFERPGLDEVGDKSRQSAGRPKGR